jgi:hypothetical protein
MVRQVVEVLMMVFDGIEGRCRRRATWFWVLLLWRCSRTVYCIGMGIALRCALPQCHGIL